MVQFRSVMEQDDPVAATSQVDEFGMTPLHILSLSQTPNLVMLLAVIKEGNVDHIIRGRDSFASTPLDYLCLNRIPSSIEVIRRVLHTRFGHLLLVPEGSSKSDAMRQLVNEALAEDWSSRRREVITAYLNLANYEQKEIFSLLELFLWKIKMDEISPKHQQQTAFVDRESCRINSGASVVISHVLPFLDKLQVEDYFIHSP